MRIALCVALLLGFAAPVLAQNVGVPQEPEPAARLRTLPQDLPAHKQPFGKQTPVQPPKIDWGPPPDPDKNAPFNKNRFYFQRDLAAAIRPVCALRFFRIDLDLNSFRDRFAAQENLDSYAAVIVPAMRDLCADVGMRRRVEKHFLILQIVHTPRQFVPDALGQTNTIVLRYDFAADKPLAKRELVPALQRAVNKLARDYDAMFVKPPTELQPLEDETPR